MMKFNKLTQLPHTKDFLVYLKTQADLKQYWFLYKSKTNLREENKKR